MGTDPSETGEETRAGNPNEATEECRLPPLLVALMSTLVHKPPIVALPSLTPEQVIALRAAMPFVHFVRGDQPEQERWEHPVSECVRALTAGDPKSFAARADAALFVAATVLSQSPSSSESDTAFMTLARCVALAWSARDMEGVPEAVSDAATKMNNAIERASGVKPVASSLADVGRKLRDLADIAQPLAESVRSENQSRCTTASPSQSMDRMQLRLILLLMRTTLRVAGRDRSVDVDDESFADCVLDEVLRVRLRGTDRHDTLALSIIVAVCHCAGFVDKEVESMRSALKKDSPRQMR